MEKPFDPIRQPDPESSKRDEETEVALNEARSIMEEYNLPQKAHFGIDIDTDSLEILSDYQQETSRNTRVILRVPREVFPKLVAEMQVAYVYEWPYSNDNSGGYGDRLVWFVTENKLRVLTETGPIDGGFMENVLYPSYMAQLSEVRGAIGNRETSFEEVRRINREKGFSVHDPLVGLGSAQVRRIKLLSPEKAKRFKDSLIAFKIQTGE